MIGSVALRFYFVVFTMEYSMLVTDSLALVPHDQPHTVVRRSSLEGQVNDDGVDLATSIVGFMG